MTREDESFPPLFVFSSREKNPPDIQACGRWIGFRFSQDTSWPEDAEEKCCGVVLWPILGML